MPAYKISKHPEIKRCAECLSNSMRFVDHLDTWICLSCGNKAREEFGQTVLPSTRELESDDIQADNATPKQETRPYFKQIRSGNNDQDYEASVKQFGSNDDSKYIGSAQSANAQDIIKWQEERQRDTRAAMQQRYQFLGTGQDIDSQETIIDQHRYKKLRDRDDHIT